MSPQVAIDERLFSWPSNDPHLLGSRCTGCGVVTFPTQGSCPGCNSEDMETIELPTRGTLWTFTTQGFRPKGPPEGGYLGDDTEDTFQTYHLGYVELPGHCKLESRLVGDSFEIGMEMELVIVPFRVDDRGDEVMTYAFKGVS